MDTTYLFLAVAGGLLITGVIVHLLFWHFFFKPIIEKAKKTYEEQSPSPTNKDDFPAT